MTTRTSVGLYGLENVLGGDFRRVTEIVRRADAEGVDQIVMTDHVVMGARTDRYPYGPFPSPPEYPWFEPMIALASFASVTERIRLSMSVLIAPLRPAVLLAKVSDSTGSPSITRRIASRPALSSDMAPSRRRGSTKRSAGCESASLRRMRRANDGSESIAALTHRSSGVASSIACRGARGT